MFDVPDIHGALWSLPSLHQGKESRLWSEDPFLPQTVMEAALGLVAQGLSPHPGSAPYQPGECGQMMFIIYIYICKFIHI